MSAAHYVTSGPLLLAVPVAAAAGLVSFASPCVLPLVPGYLSYVAGLSGAELAEARQAARAQLRGRVLAGAALFVVGFTAVFVAYGAAFGSLGELLRRHQRGIEQVLGVVTILMGLAFAGVFARLPLANREWRLHRLPGRGILGAPLLGVLFGIGWTPCIGPTLAAVQGLALNAATAGRGATLSAAYCLGLGVPFVIVALALRGGLGALAFLRRHTRTVMIVGGVLLVATGILEVSGGWDALLTTLRTNLPGFSETPL